MCSYSFRTPESITNLIIGLVLVYMVPSFSNSALMTIRRRKKQPKFPFLQGYLLLHSSASLLFRLTVHDLSILFRGSVDYYKNTPSRYDQ